MGGTGLALSGRVRSGLVLGMVLLHCVCGGVCAMAAGPAVLVATGDRTPLGLPFSRFSGVAIDSRNRVVFAGASAAIFQRRGGGLGHVVGAGDVLDGRTLAGVGPPALAADGCLAFHADFVGGGSAIYRRCGRVAEAIASVGRRVPAGPALLALGPTVGVAPDGRVAFTALVEGGATALFVADRPAALTEVMRTGVAVSGGRAFVELALVGVSQAGGVGFRGALTAGGGGLFVWDGTRVVAVAVVGDESPAGGRFAAVGGASMNDAGRWAFRAAVTRTGPGGPIDGVFTADASAWGPRVATVALGGAATPLGGTFADIPTSLVPAINGRGTIAFRAGVVGGSASAAVFTATADGRLAATAAVGDAIEGTRVVRLGDPVVADDGSVLVHATPARGTPGLFVARAGRLTALARAVDSTDLGPGFRFTGARVRGAAEDAVFLGLQEGVYMAVAPNEVTSIARLGDPTPVDGVYAGFESPAAGAHGRIVFGASVAGGRATEALFTIGPRGPALVLGSGTRVEGGGSVGELFADAFDGPGRANVGSGGVALRAGLAGPAAGPGLLVQTGRRVTAVARAGDRAPAGGRYADFGTPAVVRRRQVAFIARVGGGAGTALCLRGGTGTRLLAAVGGETRTRLGGRFATLDPPAASADGVAFRATLDGADREGIFLASERRLVALVGTDDVWVGGARWRRFGAPTFAGRGVAFLADGPTGAGLYRVSLGPGATPGAVPPRVEELAVAGEPTPIGGTFVAFGAPSGSRSRAIAFTAVLLGARASGAVVVQATGP